MSDSSETSSGLSRRAFVKTAAMAGGLALSMAPMPLFGKGVDRIRVGLIGCGGRGSGAANDCITSSEGVELYAMADLFADRLDSARKELKNVLGDRMTVTDNRCFTGFDAYRQVLESGVDMVILATPPGFRPLHFAAAVEAGKHVFMEKPVAVDLAGYRSVLASGEKARDKGLSVVAGTQYRRQPSFVEAIQRIHDGQIGEIVGAEAYYLTGPIWLRDRKPGMSDMEWQCRNWYYFTWLSGDHIVEQFVHNLDTINWTLQAVPVSALGMGARMKRVDPSYGHIYDLFSIEYVYPNGVRVEAKCRQMDGTTNRVTNRIIGTKGSADIHTDRSILRDHRGQVLFEYGKPGLNPYVKEHADLIASIRAGRPLNEAREVANSSLTGVLGRESAYTGLELTWDELLAANLDLAPKAYAFGSLPTPTVAVPGVTKLNRSGTAGETS